MLRVVLCAALVAAGCKSAEAARADASVVASPKPAPVEQPAGDVTDEHYQMPALPHAKVTLTDAAGKSFEVDAEVAATRGSRTRGLMWRWALEDTAGMLFIFSQQQNLQFWMRNTLISLDMVFIDDHANIVGIVEKAEPRTLTGRGPGAPATYVLELPGGWCAKRGIKAGQKVKIDGIGTIVAEP